MDNVGIGSDHAGGRSPLADSREATPTQQLAVDLWKEIQQVSGKVSSSINSLTGGEAFHHILETLAQPGVATAPKPQDWTIAIDLTTDFGQGQGVYSGMENLDNFARRTKGTKITIVAQAAIADTDEFDFFGPVVKADTKYKLERYVIKDGEIKQVSNDQFSKGYGQDLKDLLVYANKTNPAKHTALIMDSHGTGNEGLIGDTGKLSVDDFVKTVQDGLKGSGHDKLDMIDFDACLMSQNGAISKIRKVTDQLVAAAETESIFNGQNYLDPIRRLADKPDANGLSLARDIVLQTHKDMQEWKKDGWHPAVNSLSHLNLRQYDDFRKSLDHFGDQLLASLKEEGNKQSIESAIDSSRKYGSSGATLTALFGEKLAGKHRTDLKEFTERVLAAIDNGELNDPERSLKKAAQEVLNKRSLLVDSYHAEGDYGKAGGLSVFLPGRNLRNVEKEASLHTAAGRLSEMTEQKHFAEINKSDKSREEFLKNIKAEVFWTRPHLLFFGTAGVDKELDQIDRLADEFSKAKDKTQGADCFKQLHQATIDLAKTEPFKKQYQEQLTSLSDKVAKVFKINDIDDSNGWSRFRLKLKEGK